MRRVSGQEGSLEERPEEETSPIDQQEPLRVGL